MEEIKKEFKDCHISAINALKTGRYKDLLACLRKLSEGLATLLIIDFIGEKPGMDFIEGKRTIESRGVNNFSISDPSQQKWRKPESKDLINSIFKIYICAHPGIGNSKSQIDQRKLKTLKDYITGQLCYFHDIESQVGSHFGNNNLDNRKQANACIKFLESCFDLLKGNNIISQGLSDFFDSLDKFSADGGESNQSIRVLERKIEELEEERNAAVKEKIAALEVKDSALKEKNAALEDKEMSVKTAREKVSEIIKENEELRRENEKKENELKAKEKENEKKEAELKEEKKDKRRLAQEKKRMEKKYEVLTDPSTIIESTAKSIEKILKNLEPTSSETERQKKSEKVTVENADAKFYADTKNVETTTPMPIQNETTLKQAESPIPVQVEKMDAVGLRETPIEEDEETKKQKAFIASVLSIYTNLPFNTEIFKNGDKRLNSIFAGKTFYKEKVIKVESANISDKATQIGGFIGKEVYKLSPDCIYWEDGDVITTPEKDGAVSDSPKNPTGQHPMKTGTIRLRKSNTSLPDWLDRKIFGELGAIYAPEHQRYEFNLDLNEDELKVYLGTYFPRSYAEMFCIADNLFQNEKYLAHLSKNKEGINIFDCGCGTGGEIVGLITALCKYLPQCKINVTAIDGNNGALRIADKLIRDFPAKYCPNINITTICQTFTAVDDFAILKGLNESYQFVLCNKIACELISKRILPSNNAYAILAECLVPRLADNGLLTILDVTTKDEDSGYFYPQLMNLGLNKFVSKNEGIETLLPLSCSFNEGCNDPCFMQQSFSVSHSHKSGDESRVCYRVICKKSLKNIILGGIHIDGNAHLIHPERYNQDGEYAICKHTKDKNIIIDSFNINL